MAHDWFEIVNIIEGRRRSQSELVRQMAEVRDRYAGEYVVPLPEVEGEPSLPPAAPALMAAAIDSTAMLAASTEPDIICPALHNSDQSRARARTRERALRANWRYNQMRILRRRAYRHYSAYGTYSLMVLPDFDDKRARVEIRDPLSTYPEQRSTDDIRNPSNIGYVFGRSSDWLMSRFGDREDVRRLVAQGSDSGDDLWDVLEWIDADDIVLGVIGKRRQSFHYSQTLYPSQPAGGIELTRFPNRAGMVPAVAPRRITLDRVAGQVSQTVGLFDLMNRLMALDIVAAEKAIFPDRFIVGQDGRAPQLVSGSWKDGRSGEMNVVLDAQQIGELVSTSGPLVHPVIDRIERAIRIGGGIAPFATGETVGSLRTGRAMSELSSVSIDPRIQEMQEVMEEALRHLNRGIIEVEKGYWPSKKFTVFPGGRNGSSRELLSYQPNKDFETSENDVAYPYIGLDASQLSVVLPQRVASGMLATRSAMHADPFVDDPESEHRTILEENIDRSMMQSMLAQASDGSLPLVDVARIKELVRDGKDIVEAIQTAQREAQERQAQEVPAGAPEAQPGLAMPGQGAEAGGASPFPEVPQGMERAAQLRAVLGAIRGRA